MFNMLAILPQQLAIPVTSIKITAIVLIAAVVALGFTVLAFVFIKSTWLKRRISIIKAFRSRIFVRKSMGDKELQQAVKEAGYLYDWQQNIFYSDMNPWQRKYGYCRLYDEMCPPFGMIVDSDPIYFYYGGKNWLIEFWKGQYDMTTGCEVGAYTLEGAKLDHPGKAFYNCASNSDRLYMAYVLKKDEKPLFSRVDKHWWLTGFVLGEFSEPSELVMQIKITFKDQEMRNAFIGGLKKTGYTQSEYYATGNTVNILFDKPHSQQPFTRNPITDRVTQEKNFLLCKQFVDVTSSELNMDSKMLAVQDKSPEMMIHILNIGRPKPFFEKLMGKN